MHDWSRVILSSSSLTLHVTCECCVHCLIFTYFCTAIFTLISRFLLWTASNISVTTSGFKAAAVSVINALQGSPTLCIPTGHSQEIELGKHNSEAYFAAWHVLVNCAWSHSGTAPERFSLLHHSHPLHKHSSQIWKATWSWHHAWTGHTWWTPQSQVLYTLNWA